MSEPQTTEAPEGDKYEAAGQLLTDDLVNDTLELEASDETLATEEVTEEPKGQEEELAKADEGAAQEEELEKKPDAEPEDPPNWKWKRVREKEAEAKQRILEAEQATREANQLKSDLQELAQNMVKSPVETIYALAERAGVDGDQLYEQIIRQKITQGHDSPEMQEIRRLRKELAEKDEREKEESREIQTKRQVAQREEYVNGVVQQSMSIAEVPDLAKEYPNIASLDPNEIAGRVRHGVNWVLDNRPQTKFPELLSAIEKTVKAENDRRLQRLGARRVEEPSKTPQAKKPERTSLSNNDHASSAPKVKSDISLSPAERYALAAKVL